MTSKEIMEMHTKIMFIIEDAINAETAKLDYAEGHILMWGVLSSACATAAIALAGRNATLEYKLKCLDSIKTEAASILKSQYRSSESGHHIM